MFLACKSESSQTYEPTNDIAAPTVEETQAIDSLSKVEEKILEENVPEPIIKKKEEIRKKKRENSIFTDEGCCSSEPPPAVCCCEPVLLKYLELLKTSDAEKIAKVRSEDPILNDCYKKIPSFKKKIDEMEMSEEEE
mgnify:CR=1 FL=1